MIKKIINILATISSFIFQYRMINKIRIFDILFYSSYMKRCFASCGDGFIAGRGLTIENSHSIIIGKNVTIGKRCVITSWNKFKTNLFIADGVNIGDETHITALNRISIGKDVLIARKVTITDNSHGNIGIKEAIIPPTQRCLVSKGSVFIGDKVWIGEKATILPGVSIGECAIVGANAVITKNVEPYTVVAGNPARVIKVLN